MALSTTITETAAEDVAKKAAKTAAEDAAKKTAKTAAEDAAKKAALVGTVGSGAYLFSTNQIGNVFNKIGSNIGDAGNGLLKGLGIDVSTIWSTFIIIFIIVIIFVIYKFTAK